MTDGHSGWLPVMKLAAQADFVRLTLPDAFVVGVN